MGTFAETAIVDYRLSFAHWENKLLFSISVCSKQTEVSRFRFPFAANNEGRRFPLVLFSICGILETGQQLILSLTAVFLHLLLLP
jgi:hypothetical protein